jgi:TRAP-type transport system large permease protein
MLDALIGFAAFLALAFLRVPMAFAMGIVGFFGVAYKLNFNVAAAMIAQVTYETGLAYTLSVIPLFILMGNFVAHAKMSEELYHAAYCFLGHRRGGLAMSTVVACAGFGAICGSSIATAATFTKVAYPSMRKYGYKDTLAAGSIAAGGTLGILIPPSVIMVIYGVLAQVSIGDLFLAGVIPGFVIGLLLMAMVYYLVTLGGVYAPVQPRTKLPALARAFVRAVPALAAPVLLVAGLLAGVATPTELGALTVVYAAGLGFAYRELTFGKLYRALADTLVMTGVLMFILSAAVPFGWAVAINNVPAQLSAAILAVTQDKYLVLAIINVFLLVVGCFMETTAILLIAVPTFLPLILQLGIDPVHFGLIIILNLLIGATTPPFGVLLFIVMDIAKVSFGRMVRAMLPFYVPLGIALVLVTYWPSLSLWLPRALK